ncbi:MAG: hypothetical protein MK096_00050 [Oleiphilaceae bacterium]|nr:hypothetical protein [Oleiphilaceae bacterium]
MRRIRRSARTQEGPIQVFFVSLFAAMIFGVPTAILLWFLANRELALWGPSGAHVNDLGFWLIILFFALTSVVFPKLYPRLLGKVWRFIIRYERHW